LYCRASSLWRLSIRYSDRAAWRPKSNRLHHRPCWRFIRRLLPCSPPITWLAQLGEPKLRRTGGLLGPSTRSSRLPGGGVLPTTITSCCCCSSPAAVYSGRRSGLTSVGYTPEWLLTRWRPVVFLRHRRLYLRRWAHNLQLPSHISSSPFLIGGMLSTALKFGISAAAPGVAHLRGHYAPRWFTNRICGCCSRHSLEVTTCSAARPGYQSQGMRSAYCSLHDNLEIGKIEDVVSISLFSYPHACC